MPKGRGAESVADYVEKHSGRAGFDVVFMLIPMLHDYRREDHGAILAKLSDIVDAGALTPLLDDETFDLSAVGKAYDRLTSGNAIGKVVVEI